MFGLWYSALWFSLVAYSLTLQEFFIPLLYWLFWVFSADPGFDSFHPEHTLRTLYIGKYSSTADNNAYSELSCNVNFKCSVRRKKIISISEINFLYLLNIFLYAVKTPQKEQNIFKDSTFWKLMSTLNAQADGFFL